MKEYDEKSKKNSIQKNNILLLFTIGVFFLAMSIVGYYQTHQPKQTEILVYNISTECKNLTAECIDSDQTILIYTNVTTFHLIDDSTLVLDGIHRKNYTYELFSYRFANYLRLLEDSTYIVSYINDDLSPDKKTIISVDAVYQNWGGNDTGFFEFISFEEVERHYCIRNARRLNLSVEDCGGTYNTTAEGL